jgi:hypothetical protein
MRRPKGVMEMSDAKTRWLGPKGQERKRLRVELLSDLKKVELE